MSLGKTIAKNITANYFGVTGQIIIAFFLAPFLVQTLGDTQYGIWTIVAALSGYMSLLDLGIASALTRYIARYYETQEYEKINKLINSSLFIFLIISIFIIFLSPVLASAMVSFMDFDDSLESILYTLVIIVSFDIALFVTAGVFRGVFGGFQRFEIINIARLLSMLFKAVVFYIYLSNGYGLLAMGIISIVSNIIVILFYLIVLNKYYKFTSFNTKDVDKKNISKVFHYSKFVFVAMLASQLLNYSSSFVIGFFISAAAITWFSIPWSLAEYVKQFCLAMSRTYIPVFSQLESKDNKSELYKHYISGTRYILVLSNLFCGGMMIFGSAFIHLWMGDLYADKSIYLLYIMFGSFYFIAPHLIGYALLQGVSKHKWYAYMNVGVAVISLALCLYLIQIYGLEGVAVGMALPQVIFCGLILPIYIGKYFNRSVWDYYKNTHLAMVIPFVLLILILIFFKDNWYPTSYTVLLTEALIASVLYFMAIYLFSLRGDERSIIKSVSVKAINRIV